jgi:hypothetical protein
MRTDYKSPDITNSPEDKDIRRESNGNTLYKPDKPTISKVEAAAFLEDIRKIG